MAVESASVESVGDVDDLESRLELVECGWGGLAREWVQEVGEEITQPGSEWKWEAGLWRMFLRMRDSVSPISEGELRAVVAAEEARRKIVERNNSSFEALLSDDVW